MIFADFYKNGLNRIKKAFLGETKYRIWILVNFNIRLTSFKYKNKFCYHSIRVSEAASKAASVASKAASAASFCPNDSAMHCKRFKINKNKSTCKYIIIIITIVENG